MRIMNKQEKDTPVKMQRADKIGLVDADLMDGGTRHPNLALLKIAGFLYDNGIEFQLITDPNADVSAFTRIYISKVFSFTAIPKFYADALGTVAEKKFVVGGTGWYMLEGDVRKFGELRSRDMVQLEKDRFLNKFPNKRGTRRKRGIDMAAQMPYYDLYKSYVEAKIAAGNKASHYDDYLYYSIGFLTRGCFRHCPFCVNKLEKGILPYSKLEWFLDNTKDSNGKLVRPNIYLWDDNFLGAPPEVWRPLLQELMDTQRPFQFRQGLDERILAESEYGEEIAEKLSKCKYHGDYIFAFDHWKDREKIIKALKIWKYYNDKETKFYLFCGFRLTKDSDDLLYKDVWEIFQRIKILMQYGCLGYIMRHEDYHNHPLNNIYTQIARWCNQPGFYRNLSFWQFCYKNQTFWEKSTLGIESENPFKTYDEFLDDYNAGYYTGKIKLSLPVRTVMQFVEKYKEHREEILEMFSYKLKDLKNPKLWARK